MKKELQVKLEQAQEALEEAHFLLTDGADLKFVINSLYYAFLYPIYGLLQARRIVAPLQSTAIALFEREFVQTGDFDQRFLDAIRRSFELRPSCECEGPKNVEREDVEPLLPVAREFLERIRNIAD